MQPGDNFRVAAATKQEVIDRLTVDKRNVKDPKDGRTLAEENAGAQGGDESLASKLLTVWRRMHVEVDSMPNPPTGDADPERNFIKGTVTGIRGGGSYADKLFLAPDATTPPVNLSDGSKNLSSSGQQKGNGRFERGTITLGSGAAAVVVADVEGNGTDFVKKDNMTIPFRLVDSAGANPLPANAADAVSVTALDAAAKEFTLSRGVNFDRNVEHGTEAGNASATQDFASSSDYWVVYLYGGFRGPVLEDIDPDAERGALGETSAVIGSGGALSGITPRAEGKRLTPEEQVIFEQLNNEQ